MNLNVITTQWTFSLKKKGSFNFSMRKPSHHEKVFVYFTIITVLYKTANFIIIFKS